MPRDLVPAPDRAWTTPDGRLAQFARRLARRSAHDPDEVTEGRTDRFERKAEPFEGEAVMRNPTRLAVDPLSYSLDVRSADFKRKKRREQGKSISFLSFVPNSTGYHLAKERIAGMSENPWGESPYEPPPPPPFPPANSSWTDHDDSGWGAAASVTPPRLRTPSPVASSPSPPIPTFDALPPPRAITPPNHDDDDWGDHGNSPNLPTLPNFPPAPSHADDRDRDWPQQSEERDWKPPEIDSTLPTFGQSFAPPKEANSREDRGWNDEPDLNWEGRAANLTLQDSTDDGEQGWEDHAAKQTSSIASSPHQTQFPAR